MHIVWNTSFFFFCSSHYFESLSSQIQDKAWLRSDSSVSGTFTQPSTWSRLYVQLGVDQQNNSICTCHRVFLSNTTSWMSLMDSVMTMCSGSVKITLQPPQLSSPHKVSPLTCSSEQKHMLTDSHQITRQTLSGFLPGNVAHVNVRMCQATSSEVVKVRRTGYAINTARVKVNAPLKQLSGLSDVQTSRGRRTSSELFNADGFFHALWDAPGSLLFKWIISVILYVPRIRLQTSRDSTLLILSMLAHLFIHTSEAAAPEIKRRRRVKSEWSDWEFSLNCSDRSEYWAARVWTPALMCSRMQAKCPCELPTDCLLIVLKVDGRSDGETL